MKIGILGSGLMGAKLGTIFARAGHEVVFSYARSNDKLKRLARDAKGNARAGSPTEAAKGADALLLAVHWSRVAHVLKQAGDLAGKVVVTCSLPMDARDTKLVIARTSPDPECWVSVLPAVIAVCLRLLPSHRPPFGGDRILCSEQRYSHMIRNWQGVARGMPAIPHDQCGSQASVT